MVDDVRRMPNPKNINKVVIGSNEENKRNNGGCAC